MIGGLQTLGPLWPLCPEGKDLAICVKWIKLLA